MIMYFSGTGNSRFIAEKIRKATSLETVSINDRIKSGSFDDINTETPLVFVLPTYGWKIPRIVEDFIHKTNFTGGNKAYFILTCGTDSGNAVKYARDLCAEKGFEFMGLATVVMPENYIAMFSIPDRELASLTIENAIVQVDGISERIRSLEPLAEEKKSSVIDMLKSSVVNKLFYKACISAKKFAYTDDCSRCGKCAEICPLNNISLIQGHPYWENNCTHCMACISFCPENAIEYGKKTEKKRRYYLNEDGTQK